MNQYSPNRLEDIVKAQWQPVIAVAPELLNDLMYMTSVDYSGTVIRQYKHIDTRRYINLDATGQAWLVAVHADTGEVGAKRIDLATAKAHVTGH
jgi:hypothetical protein